MQWLASEIIVDAPHFVACYFGMSTTSRPLPASSPAALASKRRRSLLLPAAGDRGRGRETGRREAAISAFVASLPPGSAVRVREVIGGAGLRLTKDQRRSVGAALVALGYAPHGQGPARCYSRKGSA